VYVSTHCTNKEVLCSGNKDFGSISEEVLNRNVIISVNPVMYKPSVKMEIFE
jgi:hypothetical protein